MGRDVVCTNMLAQRVRMPDAATNEAEKRRATNHYCDTPAAGSESEGVSGMDAGSVRACGVVRLVIRFKLQMQCWISVESGGTKLGLRVIHDLGEFRIIHSTIRHTLPTEVA